MHTREGKIIGYRIQMFTYLAYAYQGMEVSLDIGYRCLLTQCMHTREGKYHWIQDIDVYLPSVCIPGKGSIIGFRIQMFTYLAYAYQGREVKRRSRGEKTSSKTLDTKSYLKEFISLCHKFKFYNPSIFEILKIFKILVLPR